MELQNLFKEYEQIPLYVKKCTLFTLYFRLYLHSVSKENSSMTQILDHHQCQRKVWKIGGVSSHTRSFRGKGFASFSAKNLVCICTPRHPISAGPDHITTLMKSLYRIFQIASFRADGEKKTPVITNNWSLLEKFGMF